MTEQKQNNLISAIIKTYNCEDSICDTLESLKDLDEIIVIDEHSTDDTVEIAKEYKAKIIYADKNDLSIGINQAINEAKGEWILIAQEDEIFSQKLVLNLQSYVENPKKNKFCVAFSQKIFYLNKEIKSARIKKTIRLFKKGFAEFKNNYSLELKLKQGKIHKINKNFKKKNESILKFIKKDFSRMILEMIEKNRNLVKIYKTKRASLVFKPLCVFVNWFIFKGAIFDGKYGFIYAKTKSLEEFILQNMILEKNLKGVENDF